MLRPVRQSRDAPIDILTQIHTIERKPQKAQKSTEAPDFCLREIHTENTGSTEKIFVTTKAKSSRIVNLVSLVG